MLIINKSDQFMAFLKNFFKADNSIKTQNGATQEDNNAAGRVEIPADQDKDHTTKDETAPVFAEPWIIIKKLSSEWFLVPILDEQQRQVIVGSGDPVRYGSIHLAFDQMLKENIPGSLAECGVYKGHLSKFIHAKFPERKLYLFDTFEGFDNRDADSPNDSRFRDTSEEGAKQHIGNIDNIIFRKGYFPETATGLGNETFAFVMLDFDKYEPTLAALKLFYPLVSRGGFIFIHDYSSPESNWACSRALNEFLADKPEKPILIPDSWGTALFRKI
jgi:O-methyltransferase